MTIPAIPPAYPFTAAGLAMARAADAAAQRTLLGVLAETVQYVTPTTGQTVVSDGSGTLLIDPAGSLLALTVTVPSTPADKQAWRMATSQAVTTLTINGGTIVGTVTTLAVAGFVDLLFNTASAKWFRVG